MSGRADRKVGGMAPWHHVLVYEITKLLQRDESARLTLNLFTVPWSTRCPARSNIGNYRYLSHFVVLRPNR